MYDFRYGEPVARNFDYQDPVKDKIVRESNHKYGGNPVKGKIRQPKTSRYNHYEYDYYSSAWERLLNKTQKTQEFLTKGDFARAKQRNVESEISHRIITPSSISAQTNFDEKFIQEITNQAPVLKERPANMNTKSTFKMAYTPLECSKPSMIVF